jgi:hypothetical protein
VISCLSKLLLCPDLLVNAAELDALSGAEDLEMSEKLSLDLIERMIEWIHADMVLPEK